MKAARLTCMPDHPLPRLRTKVEVVQTSTLASSPRWLETWSPSRRARLGSWCRDLDMISALQTLSRLLEARRHGHRTRARGRLPRCSRLSHRTTIRSFRRSRASTRKTLSTRCRTRNLPMRFFRCRRRAREMELWSRLVSLATRRHPTDPWMSSMDRLPTTWVRVAWPITIDQSKWWDHHMLREIRTATIYQARLLLLKSSQTPLERRVQWECHRVLFTRTSTWPR